MYLRTSVTDTSWRNQNPAYRGNFERTEQNAVGTSRELLCEGRRDKGMMNNYTDW